MLKGSVNPAPALTSPTISTNLIMTRTDSSGTPGAATISTPRGRCSIAAAGTTVTITSTIVTAASTVLCVVSSNDATATLKNCVPGAGSFVITLTAGATATVNIDFIVIN